MLKNDAVKKYAVKVGNLTVVHTVDPDGGYTYSVGLTDVGHSEVIICGLQPEISQLMFVAILKRLEAGFPVPLDQLIDGLLNVPVVFKSVQLADAERYAELAVQGYRGEGKTPAFMQMVIPDPKGNFPWSEHYDATLMWAQRLLYEQQH